MRLIEGYHERQVFYRATRSPSQHGVLFQRFLRLFRCPRFVPVAALHFRKVNRVVLGDEAVHDRRQGVGDVNAVQAARKSPYGLGSGQSTLEVSED